MAWRRLGEVTGGDGLTALAARAGRIASVLATFRAALPAWLDASQLQCSVSRGGTLEINAPAGLCRQIQGILPSLRLAMRPHGITTIVAKPGLPPT